ncbi:MAG TPA: BrnA antitoxin family protein [Acetobacteraceae bacterium]|jgi:uncharacterized protein (DUF4415 family)|nr:BrnA antitoxin family protein [Acetobacteraceae bacterium]
MKTKSKNDPASRPDEENPEWTPEEMRHARPALDLVGQVFGTAAATALRRGRGRPEKPDRKVNLTLRIDPDVLEAYRHEGKGWQTRINQVLREHMPDRRR